MLMSRTFRPTPWIRRNAFIGAGLLFVLFSILPPHLAASEGRSSFFASRAACIASEKFDARDCAAAFASAAERLRDRRFIFPSKIDCVLTFRLCERLDGAGFGPVLLGVEMVSGRGGGVTLPVLAVETRRDEIAPTPIRVAVAVHWRPLASTSNDQGDLPTDRFSPVDPSGVRALWGHFQPPRRLVVQASAREDWADADRESAEARRARLREAPFVQ